MVTAELGPFMKEGQALDVTVSTVGSAKSLQGGTLLMTPLLGADGEIYGIAQGNLVVGGLGVEGNDGSSLTVNIPTVGRIPGGATVERVVDTPLMDNEYILLNLHRADFSTAAAVQQAIDDSFGPGTAVAIDGSSIKVRAPADPGSRIGFLGMLEKYPRNARCPACARCGQFAYRHRGDWWQCAGYACGGDTWVADRARDRGFQRGPRRNRGGGRRWSGGRAG